MGSWRSWRFHFGSWGTQALDKPPVGDQHIALMNRESGTQSLPGIAARFLDEMRSVATELAGRGWAEANAGNFSYRLDRIAGLTGRQTGLPVPIPELAGRCLLISVTGSRMRDVTQNPIPNLCLLQFDDRGTSYLFVGDRPASSELPVHLACHAALTRHRPQDVALLHTHPTALAALSLVYPEPESLLALLVRSHAEMRVYGPRVGALPFIEPGSQALADATARVLVEKSGVIWPRHGMIAAGPDLRGALDLVEVCDKAAEVALLTGEPAPPTRILTQAATRTRLRRGQTAPDGIETFHDVRSRDSQLSPDEFSRLPRRPITLVLDNLRSAFNVGSVFRIADAVRAKEVITCGYTCRPPHHKLEQTALGTTGSVPCRHFEATLDAVRELRTAGVQVVALETAATAVPYCEFEFRPGCAVVLGNEALGVSQSVLQACDAVIDLPVFGFKNSINVAAAAAVVLYDLVRRYDWLK